MNSKKENDMMENNNYKINGGFKKIGEANKPCLSPEHNPPSYIVLEPGRYEYTCPACGKVTVFDVQGITF